jgi:hypothetical protein
MVHAFQHSGTMAIRFGFYPRHEHNRPNVSHCPHSGGAALGTLVLLANEQELTRRSLHATIDAERARRDRLFVETEAGAAEQVRHQQAHRAGAKQKCLFHMARNARDWQNLPTTDSAVSLLTQ